MFAGPCSAATILICSSAAPKPKCSPCSEFLMLFRNPPSAIILTSYTCLTRAGLFASWLNSLRFQSDLVYTSCACVSLTADPKVANAATLVAAVLTNDLRFIRLTTSLQSLIDSCKPPPGQPSCKPQEGAAQLPRSDNPHFLRIPARSDC